MTTEPEMEAFRRVMEAMAAASAVAAHHSWKFVIRSYPATERVTGETEQTRVVAARAAMAAMAEAYLPVRSRQKLVGFWTTGQAKEDGADASAAPALVVTAVVSTV
jgi:hypothetical protein